MGRSRGGRSRGAPPVRAGAGLLLGLFCLCLCMAAAGRAVAADGDKPSDRVATVLIKVGWDQARQDVVITQTCRYTLAAGSDALAGLREDGSADCLGYTLLLDGEEPIYDGSNGDTTRVTQASARAPVHVWSRSTLGLHVRSGHPKVEIAPEPVGERYGTAHGFPPDWTMTVSAPKWTFSRIRGPVAAQDGTTLTWRLQRASRAPTQVGDGTRSVILSRGVKVSGPPVLRHQTRAELLGSLVAAIAGITAVVALLVAGPAGPAVSRRWKWATALLGATVVLCALRGGPQISLQWPGTVTTENVSGLVPFAPGFVWAPGAYLGLWWWYVLPLAFWWFTCRVRTGRPPSTPALLAGCLSPLCALILLAGAGEEVPSVTWTAVPAAALLLAVLAQAGRLRPNGSAVRRWAPTAAALLWTAFLIHRLSKVPYIAGAGWLISGPVLSGATVWPRLTMPLAGQLAVLCCTWPAAACLASLLASALRRTVRPPLHALCFLLFWALLLLPYLIACLTPVPATREPTWSALQRTGSGGDAHWAAYQRSPFGGYSAWLPFVLVVCVIVLQLFYLRRRGELGGAGRAVEPVGRLLLLGATLTAYGSPSLRTLTMWGEGAAVLWVGLASLMLLPPGTAESAARLRRVSARGHARFMERWLVTQLIWDTRADFQRSARSSLAGDMKVAEFTDRWERLAVPGHRDDPESRLRRARQYALGTNAGRTPWSAGFAGARRALLLALPWAAYKAVTGGVVGADYFMPFHLDELSKVLRFGHWALYGFVFGYFYALLRGVTPVGKAARLMLVILPAEVLPMLSLTIDPQYTAHPSWSDMAAGCAGAAGQTLVLCMLLGLWWEWSLARAAGMKWSQVRNLRRLSSITVPAGTVLVAAATAFATTIAGTLAQPETPPPAPQQTQSAPPATP
ncbi:hypothetical protein [Streptomyces sp. NPDC047028]|uniref:hypothetical protein n=1 Tax=Streptomyces sp. NPDC047028 TaxID=3155793 RepID=UPI0033D0B38B